MSAIFFEPDPRARRYAALCHSVALLGCILPVVGNLLGPLVAWVCTRRIDPFVAENGKAALHFQISLHLFASLLALICWLLGAAPLATPFLFILVYLYSAVIALVSAHHALSGTLFKHPKLPRFLR
jgi:uncharacterized Tic20 family protein